VGGPLKPAFGLSGSVPTQPTSRGVGHPPYPHNEHRVVWATPPHPHNQHRVVRATRLTHTTNIALCCMGRCMGHPPYPPVPCSRETQTVTQVTVSLLDQPFHPPVSAFGHSGCQPADAQAKLLNLKRKLSGSKVPFALWIAPEKRVFRSASSDYECTRRVGNVASSSQCVAG
jgi:hypothetical protein